MANTIHPTAIIDPSATIGSDNVIGPFCIIEADTHIGDGNIIEAHSVIKRYTRIGNQNRIHSFVMLGDIPQDLKFNGEKTELWVGDSNTFREHATVHRGPVQDDAKTVIGNNNLFMTNIHVAHDCVIGNHVIMSSNASIAGHVHLEDHCIIGGFAGIHQFTRIGIYSFIAAMSGIARDVPPYMIASDRRSVATIHGINLVGLRRAGVSREAIHALKEASTILWKTEGETREVLLDKIDELYGTFEEIQTFLTFIRNTKRGILGLTSEEE